MKLINLLKKYKIQITVLILITIFSGVTHAFNMFKFPYFENDEGVYLSQAWSLINLGKLTPYTYWYDHAPAGWILISFWSFLFGFINFGFSLESGRIFMLLIHIISSILVFFITYRISKSYTAGIVASIFFSLSPLGIYYQRRILLDNLMIFWILVSLSLILVEKIKLRHVIFSAVSAGIAILTKENAVFFLPGLFYGLKMNLHSAHKNLALIKWLVIVIFIISIYLLYALLKGELFPSGFLGNNDPHTSLLGTLKDQLNRGNGLPFWNIRSDFYLSFNEWIKKDTILILVGALSVIVNGIVSIKVKKLRIITLLSVLFILFLIRGKLVIDFYVIPLIPLLAINIAVLLNYISTSLSFGKNYIYLILIGYLTIVIVGAQVYISRDQFFEDETTPQVNAFNWITKNISKNDVIVVDDFAEVDYRKNGFKNAFWFYKVWEDPEIQNKINNDWRNIDYIFLSHELVKQIGVREKEDIIKTALANSQQIIKFGPNDPSTYLNIDKYISTNGDWAAIYKVNKEKQDSLAWQYYKKNFITSYGQSIDPDREYKTTSEGQSYIMLRSVFENDEDTFIGAWSWTRDHLQTRTQDNLFSWLWGERDGKEQIVESANATDADLDIALALILASRKWDNLYYEKEAKLIINDIWKKSVLNINGRYYLSAGEGFKKPDGLVMNPSYFSPAAYRVFDSIDNSPWEKLANDTYFALNEINKLKENEKNIPVNWIFITNGGDLSSAKKYVENYPDAYGFDAFRVFWRVGLDAKWFSNKNAYDYLKNSQEFYKEEFTEKKEFKSIYSLSGKPEVNYSNISVNTGPLSIFSVVNRKIADDIYRTLIKPKYSSKGYWGDGKNYYDQNWVWFGTALYSNNLPLYK